MDTVVPAFVMDKNIEPLPGSRHRDIEQTLGHAARNARPFISLPRQARFPPPIPADEAVHYHASLSKRLLMNMSCSLVNSPMFFSIHRRSPEKIAAWASEER
jgi:hypothetical protein